MAMVTDSVYPYFSTVYLPENTVDDSMERLVPGWRGLVESEAGLEFCLRHFPPQFVTEFRLQNSNGRVAQDEGDWERAESSFLQCKAMLGGEGVCVEEQAHAFLLVWASLPLARLYQFRGSADMSDIRRCVDMLKKAIYVWEEICKCISPLIASRPTLKKVCLSYYCTSIYEYSTLINSSEGENDAVNHYAALIGCDRDDAEPQLCLLLWGDHYFSTGSFEVSLWWIQKANQLWKQKSRVGNCCPFHCLEIEIELLIKLEKYEVALKVLLDSPYCDDHVIKTQYDVAEQIRQWLQQCYVQMSRRAAESGDFLQADVYEAQALSFGTSLRRDDYQENCPSESSNVSSDSHPMLIRTPFPLGSSLGLIQENDECLSRHLQKLPSVIRSNLQLRFSDVQAARERGDWETEICNYQMCREFLKIAKKLVDAKTYNWLLTWFELPLANLYHYRAKKYENAMEIWKEIGDCAKQQLSSDPYLTRFYESTLYIVEFELKRFSTSEGSSEVVQRWAESCSTDDLELCERHMCFYLYFGHHQHGNLEVSLDWLREAKRLRGEHCPDTKCSNHYDGSDYFCCEYDYLRCEADLLMKLQKFEEATIVLENLLETTHVQQGSRKVTIEAKGWLKHCSYMQMSGCLPEDIELQRALDLSLIDDNSEQEEIEDQAPSSSGFIFLSHNKVFPQVVQSQAGLEHHLHKLPVPVSQAFRRHSDFGRVCQHLADWGTAIFHFEWCKELLKLSRSATEKETYDWLTAWACVPLVELYGYGIRHFKNALDSIMEMWECVQQDDSNALDDRRQIQAQLVMLMYAERYRCAVADYPHMKDVIVRKYASLVGSEEWASEESLLKYLYESSLVHGDVEASLDCILRGKQLVNEHVSGQEHDAKIMEFVIRKAICLITLRRIDDANRVVNEYWVSSGKSQDELPAKLQLLLKVCASKRMDQRTQMELLEPSPLTQLRLEAFELEEKKEYEKAVRCHESCLEMINKSGSAPERLDVTLDYGHKLGFFDNYRLGELHMRIFFEKVRDLSLEQLMAFHQDENFSRAVQHFENSMKLSLPVTDSVTFATINYHLVLLYGAVFTVYGFHTFRRYNQVTSRFDDADPSMKQQVHDLCHMVRAYLLFPDLIEMYGRKASSQFSSLLYMMQNQRNAEGWIDSLEGHKMLYTFLQDHFYRKATYTAIWNQMMVGQVREEEIGAYRWTAFLYAERERTRVMLYELGSNNSASLSELIHFDADDTSACDAVKKSCATLLEGDTVFVQYSLMTDQRTYLIYVVDQFGKLSMTHTREDHEEEVTESARKRSLERRLKDLHTYFEPPKRRARPSRYNCDSMNEDLEYLYDVLIMPIAEHLVNMKPEHKLILAPSELLTKVPFAALRDKRSKEYLIERHTIAVNPSLRILQICTERLLELQNAPPYTGPGAVVALGDPSYVCKKCTKRKRLVGSGEEVDNIANSFGDIAVVKLLREEATAGNLLQWAAKPSQESFRQAVIHIGAHAVINEEDHRMSVLQLACPAGICDSLAAQKDMIISSFPGRGRSEDESDDDSDSDDELFYGANSDDEVDRTIIAPRLISSVCDHLRERRFESYAASTLGRSGDSAQSHSLVPNQNEFHDLKVEDISSSRTKWRAELVVLSACRSSRGRMTAEGVLSLARAFVIAGVPCVVASLWEVLDQPTAALMEVMYDALRDGNDIASALRAAMLSRLATHRNQVHEWAPFNVWGVPTLRLSQALQKQSSTP